MSITKESELIGMKRISEAVALTLRHMREYAAPGMSTWELDQYGASLLKKFGAHSAPKITYGFPGYTCISVNQEIAHGIPSKERILHEGDLVNIDVSAEKDGFFADNGGSFVLGEDIHGHQALVDASKEILQLALSQITGGLKVNQIGKLIETQSKKRGFRVIRNLAGHGVGRGLHEKPHEILNCYDAFNRDRFGCNMVVAVETFISTQSTQAITARDGWTLLGNKGGFTAQHEHTLVVRDGEPMILTEANGIWA
ncbi:type I methionyl aminopeptidase [Cytophagales bacterium LB-30]|uniref:Methionine aminopeptidase n=1 Tax=Shiella aurantiaca TaxID=3058365 RepID=A0ABT8F3I0_9BACT|nr:type I methionyl aminopeptidase [Shiella aurantiaca]MDN4164799.1 type I methionyl aminopeptidase [Shiella aurantiaca]